MAEALVEARGLTRTYRIGEQVIVAVHDATCRVYPGQRIALEGPSGSGKSTLLLMLGGIEEPAGGQLAWPAFGTAGELRPRHIAYVFQTEALLAPLTARENIELALVLQGHDREIAAARASDVLDRFELTAVAEKLPEELSGGQAQRVGFVRALAMRPELILADEPTGQLDSHTAGSFLDSALRMLDRDRTALIVATHDRRVADRMAVRWHMEHGRLQVPAC